MKSTARSAIRLALGLLALFTYASVDAQSPPFCKGLDCPKYSVQVIGDGVELRQYDSATWVSTVVNGATYGQAKRTGFQRLFHYITGGNEAQLTMEMTTPVREQLLQSGGKIEGDIIMSFFLPFAYQDNAPAPLDKDVYLEKVAPKVYVSSFGGFAPEGTIMSHAGDLLEKLESMGIDVNSQRYYYCGYDAPFVLVDRHNEIWYAAKDAQTVYVT